MDSLKKYVLERMGRTIKEEDLENISEETLLLAVALLALRRTVWEGLREKDSAE